MKEEIKQFVVENLSFLPQEVIVVVISALPILELRGGIPLAYTFDFSFFKAFSLSLLGNALPIIPLLLLFHPLSNWLMKFKWYKRFYDWLYHRTINKSKNVDKYGAIGLILFTAVPLPTTGAYSACVAAALFAIRFKYAFLSILAGVIIAGLGVGAAIYSIF
ncbi:COG2426 family protein [Bacillus sp. RAR_GA_16]|uniref:COG2426 family protein n=1 Tax=Bacillus sp. RAR_GA_16 TaxID=2876774 RepID=UPI001CCA42AF|nr:small multi-drug export protein [Bacillus sp. RAR_GA_16]MCA0171731.1 small multi-drug export protein [Bacillus sp. RAR_GA_16]